MLMGYHRHFRRSIMTSPKKAGLMRLLFCSQPSVKFAVKTTAYANKRVLLKSRKKTFSHKCASFPWSRLILVGEWGREGVSLLVWVKLILPFFWEVRIQDFSGLKFAIILNMQCSILTWNQLYSWKCIFNCIFSFLTYALALESIKTCATL